MSQIEIYVDQDAMDSDLVAALRSRGVTVITALDAGLAGKCDGEQLALAAEQGCVLFTFNVADFYRRHTEWIAAGRDHAGMILGPRQRFSVGEQLRRILRLRAATTTLSIRNQVEFLGNWGWPRAHWSQTRANHAQQGCLTWGPSGIWLPVVDTFRTLLACPPPAVRIVLQQIQTLAVASILSAPPTTLNLRTRRERSAR